MEYITAKQAAAQWGVTDRQVQRSAAAGRLPGAKKLGAAWLIPAGCEKPQDLRRHAEEKKVPPFPSLFWAAVPLDKAAPEASLLALPPEFSRLAFADLAYRRGDPAPALACWHSTPPGDPTRLTAASLALSAAISAGDASVYRDILAALQAAAAQAADEKEKALLSLPLTVTAVGMAAPAMTPLWLRQADFSLFPPELSPLLLYLYALHLRNIGDHAAMLATARAAALLCRRPDTFTWYDVYFPLLCASAGYALGDAPQAARYLEEALALGMPYGFVMPFSDYLGDLSALMEPHMQLRYPLEFRRIKTLWNSSFKNWMRFHNDYTRENITTILTVQEYHVARLIAHGAPYAEAARHMNLSIGRTKNIVQGIYGKLQIQNRHQLRAFVL